MNTVQTKNQRLIDIQGFPELKSLIVTHFHSKEIISQPFHIHLDLLSSNIDLKPEKIIGKSATLMINKNNQQTPCYFNGIVNQFSLGEQAHHCRQYQMTIVPWLWYLKQITHSRIFHNKTIIEIITQIFDALGFSDYDYSGIKKKFPKKEHCIQFQESNFNFISRLLEEADIHYYFRHEKNRHVLMLIDHQEAFPAYPTPLKYNPYQSSLESSLYNWQPQSSLHQEHIFGSSDYLGLHAGMCISNATQSDALNNRFVLTHIEQEAYDETLTEKFHLPREKITTTQFYQNNFFALQHNAFICQTNNAPNIPTPMIDGTQIATVVGPQKGDVYVNKKGQVKIKFSWDCQYQTHQDGCWVSVSSPWAGRNEGIQMIPRVGQKVIISFNNGHPNNPFIIGSLSQRNTSTPIKLPAQKNCSGIYSQSIPYNSQQNNLVGNTILFDDKTHQEKIFIRAKKDFIQIINQDLLETIDNNQIIEIKQGHQTTTISKGSFNINAKSIIFRVGQSELKINEKGIQINSPLIQLSSPDNHSTKPAARVGDNHSCPKKTPSEQPHVGGPILEGASDVFINNKPAARMNDLAQCEFKNDTIQEGTSHLLINNQPAARQDNKTTHGGKILAGSPNVEI